MIKYEKILFIVLSIIVLLTMMTIIDAFNDIESKGLPQASGIAGQQNLDNILSLQVGSGSNVLHSDQSGLWLGASKFVDAPFSVDMLGVLLAKSATFKDDTDTTIIDSKGLVSTASFKSGSVIKTTNQTIHGTSYVDVGGLSITTTFSTTRTVNILLLVSITGYHTEFDGCIVYRIRIDDGDVGQEFVIPSNYYGSEATITGQVITSVTAGEHTIKVIARENNNSDAYIDAAFGTGAVLSYIILGN